MITRKKTHFTLYATLMLLLAVGLYGLYQARNLLEGPVLILESPQNGSLLTTSLVTVEGTAHNITHVTLNGRGILTDKQGHFKEQLLLSDGYNIITVDAVDQFGKRTHKTLELVYKGGGEHSRSTSAARLTDS